MWNNKYSHPFVMQTVTYLSDSTCNLHLFTKNRINRDVLRALLDVTHSQNFLRYTNVSMMMDRRSATHSLSSAAYLVYSSITWMVVSNKNLMELLTQQLAPEIFLNHYLGKLLWQENANQVLRGIRCWYRWYNIAYDQTHYLHHWRPWKGPVR